MEELKDIELLEKEGRYWLSVKSSNGKFGLLCLNELKCGPLTKQAFLEWAGDNWNARAEQPVHIAERKRDGHFYMNENAKPFEDTRAEQPEGICQEPAEHAYCNKVVKICGEQGDVGCIHYGGSKPEASIAIGKKVEIDGEAPFSELVAKPEASKDKMYGGFHPCEKCFYPVKNGEECERCGSKDKGEHS